MRTNEFRYSRNVPADANSYTLNCRVWLPDNCDPYAILQVIHGMTEHMGRYTALAEHLTAHGIAVAGFDLRGHVRNQGDPDCASFVSGKTDSHSGWDASLNDIDRFSQLLHEQFPNAKHFMLGFSLGSFLLRDYMIRFPCNHLCGVILMGTGDQPAGVLKVMKAIVKTQIRKAGVGHTTDLVRKLSFGVYNNKFKPTNTRADWLTSDEYARGQYLGDPLCRKDIAADLFYELLSAMERTGKVKQINHNHDLNNFPVLLLSGADDPVGDMLKGIHSMRKKLGKAGMTNVYMISYPGGRHDILQEKKEIAQSVSSDILEFIRHYASK